ncbi:MAG: nucleoside-diphosphate sugar epimerase/dehydratase [Pseudomonadota bacterium]
MYSYLLSLPRPAKSALLLGLDLSAIAVAYVVAQMLRLSSLWPAVTLERGLPALALSLGLGVALSVLFRVHVVKIAAFEPRDLLRLALWAIGVTAATTLANLILPLGAPRTVPMIQGTVLIAFLVLIRLGLLGSLLTLRGHATGSERVAIYGAGAAGLQMASALSRSTEYRPVLLVDDDPRLHGVRMAGLSVVEPARLERMVQRGRVARIFVAIPSLGRAKRRALLARLGELGVPVEALPSYIEMVGGAGIVDSLRPVAAEELLGRDRVELDMPRIAEGYAGRAVLVSGAGGSIGSDLCRQLVAAGVSRLVLLERSELALYEIERDLAPLAAEADLALVPRLGDVCDRDGGVRLMREHGIEIVLHAAAYKHVPLMEDNEVEGVRNNVLGTRALALAASEAGVARFILVSTDKAVRPTNVMGATKRLAEMVVQDQQGRASGTVFSMVRFGNVLGSSGSVLPLFRRQIADGGPVTLTHRDVTRYFMTIPEAARLVLLAGSYAEGGEVFVLDMGAPVRIADLARRMIELSGRTVRDADNPDGEIEIEVLGLRPGEKLYEELLVDDDMLSTPHPKILRAQEVGLSPEVLTATLARIETAVNGRDGAALRAELRMAVAGYATESELWVEAAGAEARKVLDEQMARERSPA